MNLRPLGMAAPLALVAACASGPSARPQLTEATGSIRAAEEVGARDLPDAALLLKLAEENSKRGQKLIEEDEQVAARRALERAELDAELAIALVKERTAKNELGELDQELGEMRTRLENSK